MGVGRLSVYGLNGSERMAFSCLFGGWFLSLRLWPSYMVGAEGSVSPPFECSHSVRHVGSRVSVAGRCECLGGLERLELVRLSATNNQGRTVTDRGNPTV